MENDANRVRKTIALKRPDATHSWGICYAILPDGPEILKVMESPAFGQVKAGQIIKKINGENVVGLTRDAVVELMNIDEEDMVLEVVESTAATESPREFGTMYGRGSVGSRNLTCQQSDATDRNAREGSTVKMPVNLPDVRDEFRRIHRERKLSRDATINTLENARFQRCASVNLPSHSSSTPSEWTRPLRPVHQNSLQDSVLGSTNGVSKRPPGLPVAGNNEGSPVPSASDLRYTGVRVPSRTFQALAMLVGMDPSGANHTEVVDPNASGKIAEPCRTVIDVRAAAEEMRLNSLRDSSRKNSFTAEARIDSPQTESAEKPWPNGYSNSPRRDSFTAKACIDYLQSADSIPL